MSKTGHLCLKGTYYVQRKLLLVSGGVFTLTVRGVSPGHRGTALYRFRLRTRDGWETVAPGVMEASIMCSKAA